MRKKLCKKIVTTICCVTMLCAFGACSKAEDGKNTDAGTTKVEDVIALTTTPEAAVTPEATATPEPTATPAPTPTEAVHVPAKNESVIIPREYVKYNEDFLGQIVDINYTTYAYYGDGSEITKHANVYLPPEYDENGQYNVLYLMHGINGDEYEWKMHESLSEVKLALDNLIYYGDIEPFIVVIPNGRSCVEYTDKSMGNADSFYEFGKELRNDLIPYIDANFATYAEYDENGYDLTAARDHRAMAGLSMGAMQTINIGICECLDIMSYFGAFSAAPTTYNAQTIAEKLQNFEEYDIHYFYNICGLSDTGSLQAGGDAVKGLSDLTDKVEDGVNMVYQTVKGAHTMSVWKLGLYNFAQIVFE